MLRFRARKAAQDRERHKLSVAAGDAENSVIGQSISAFTTKVVIIGVLTLIFAVPGLTISEYDYGDLYATAELDWLSTGGATQSGSPSPSYASTLDNYIVDRMDRLLLLAVNGDIQHPLYMNEPMLRSRRASEILRLRIFSNGTLRCQALIDRKERRQIEAAFAIGVTIFVLVLLASGSYLFSRDAFKMVIIPIKRMMLWVERVAAHPLKPVAVEEVDPVENYEMALLQGTLVRLAGLLQVSFGDAGAHVLERNLQGDLDDPLGSGVKIMGIFGFCDIRSFDKLTEGLLGDIMETVNAVAALLHRRVALCGGNANKNIGNAFLLVWKFPPSKAELARLEAKQASAIADLVNPVSTVSPHHFISHHQVYSDVLMISVLSFCSCSHPCPCSHYFCLVFPC